MSVLTLPFNIVLGQLFIATGRKKSKGTKFWWKEINLSLLTNNDFLHREYQGISKILLELVNEMNLSAKSKNEMIGKKLYFCTLV